MPSDDSRYSLSPEDIGILLSFANRPEAATQEWVQRLMTGVRGDELLEFFRLAGLPLATASTIMSTDTSRGMPINDKWSQRSARYRRASLGFLVAYVVMAVGLSLAAGGPSLGLLVFASASVLAAVVVYRAIVRLSPGMG